MYKRPKANEDYSIKIGELRNLLWWAKFGVKSSNGGSGQKTIIQTIRKLATDIKMQVETKKDPIRFSKYTN